LPVVSAPQVTTVPRFPAARAEVEAVADIPPGLIRLMGWRVVMGPAGQFGSRVVDMWALLGLLAENRRLLLTRQAAQDKIWPDALPTPDRFHVLLKDTRVKLCDALGRPRNHGKLVIQHLAGNGYRINPELFSCDIWRLRDVLASAATDHVQDKTTALAAAVDLYTGPYLPEIPHGWAQEAARTVRREVVQALTQLAQLNTNPEYAVFHLERATDLDVTAQPLYRQRMQIYAAKGRLEDVRYCYEVLNYHLNAAGRKPDAKTTELYRRLMSTM
jgi:DNA-binding SARP family transcriptional activator